MEHLRDADINLDVLPSIKSVSAKFKNLKECFTTALKREEELSHHIKSTLLFARENKDLYTEVLMTEFVKEQIEEEKLFKDHIQTLELYMRRDNITGFDDYLAKRKK